MSDFPTVSPINGLELNDTKTDVVLYWATTNTVLHWARHAIHALLLQFKGQWRYDIEAGIDYLGVGFAVGQSDATLANLFRVELAAQPWISEIRTLRVRRDGDGETLIVDFNVVVQGQEITSQLDLFENPFPWVFDTTFDDTFG